MPALNTLPTLFINASADDAFAFRHDATSWALTDGGTGYQDNTVQNYITKEWNGGTNLYYLRNALWRFDTSSLLDYVTIATATLRVWCNVKADNMSVARNFTLDWYTGTWDVAGALTATEGTNAHAGTPILSLGSGAFNDIALLNPNSFINKSGTTSLRGHTSGGAPNALGAAAYALFDTYDYDVANSTTHKAQLIITYYDQDDGPGSAYIQLGTAG